MNKNYRKALINELFDQGILKNEDDRDEIKQIIAKHEEGLELGDSFEEDVEALKEAWRQRKIQAQIEKICSQLHVGRNILPFGIAYAASEEDLEGLKDAVREFLLTYCLPSRDEEED